MFSTLASLDLFDVSALGLGAQFVKEKISYNQSQEGVQQVKWITVTDFRSVGWREIKLSRR